jgi:trk system potassium uptake protein TrkA
MYIVIVGAGQIGSNLAKSLLALGREVVVVERDSQRIANLTEEIGSGVVEGDGSTLEVLKASGVSRASIVIAATESDETNLAVCQLAKHVFQTPRTLAVICNPAHDALFQLLGIDVVINRTRLIMSHIEEEIGNSTLVHQVSSGGDNMDIVSISIPSDAAVVGSSLGALDLPPNSFICLVVKDEGPVLPKSDLSLASGDRLIMVTAPDEEQVLYEIFTGIN